MSKQIENIIKKLAIKYNLSEITVDRIITNQFKFVVKEIESQELNNIMLQHIGKFCMSNGKRYFTKLKMEKKIKRKLLKDANGTNNIK